MATKYLVLRAGTTPPSDSNTTDVALAWYQVGEFLATSAEAAKAAAAVEHGDGTYAATPARSWQPSAFKVEPRAVAVKT